jgi:hypothetical protein
MEFKKVHLVQVFQAVQPAEAEADLQVQIQMVKVVQVEVDVKLMGMHNCVHLETMFKQGPAVILSKMFN